MSSINNLQIALGAVKEKLNLSSSAWVENVINDKIHIREYKDGIETSYSIDVSALAEETRRKAEKAEKDARVEKIKRGKLKVSEEPMNLKYKGFSSHDCEAWYECPTCGESYGSWGLWGKPGETFKCKCGTNLIYPA